MYRKPAFQRIWRIKNLPNFFEIHKFFTKAKASRTLGLKLSWSSCINDSGNGCNNFLRLHMWLQILREEKTQLVIFRRNIWRKRNFRFSSLLDLFFTEAFRQFIGKLMLASFKFPTHFNYELTNFNKRFHIKLMSKSLTAKMLKSCRLVRKVLKKWSLLLNWKRRKQFCQYQLKNFHLKSENNYFFPKFYKKNFRPICSSGQLKISVNKPTNKFLLKAQIIFQIFRFFSRNDQNVLRSVLRQTVFISKFYFRAKSELLRTLVCLSIFL